MFSFLLGLMQLYGFFGGCSLSNWRFCYFVNPIFINEGRLNGSKNKKRRRTKYGECCINIKVLILNYTISLECLEKGDAHINQLD